MKFREVVLSVALALSGIFPAYADPSNEEMMRMVKALKERVEQLELQLAKQSRKVEKIEAVEADADADEAHGGVEFHGLVEVEMAGGEDHTGEKSSDIALATVELGFDFSAFNDRVTGRFAALHEDDATDPWVVNEAYFTIGDTAEFPVYLSAGRMFVPFGNFESGMVSDPLTLELGETQEAAILVGFAKGGLYGSVYAFNGDLDDTGENDNIENYGLNLGYAAESKNISYDFGIGWINHIGDTDGITGALHDAEVTGINDYVAGYGIHGIVRSGSFSLIGEYVAAREDFMPDDLAWRTGGARPGAYNLEVGYDFVAFGGRESHAAIAVQGTDEAAGLGLPEKKILAALSTTLYKNTLLAIEYSSADDYAVADGGTGNDGGVVVLKVAVEF